MICISLPLNHCQDRTRQALFQPVDFAEIRANLPARSPYQLTQCFSCSKSFKKVVFDQERQGLAL
jgi:hypothetical protein